MSSNNKRRVFVLDLIYEKVTEKSFNDAVESITNTLNFKNKMEEHNIEFSNNFMILEVCNPDKANEVLSKHLEIGYFLPCKVVVYEKDDQVRIGTARPEKLMGMMGHDDLGDIAIEVEKILIESIDAAV